MIELKKIDALKSGIRLFKDFNWCIRDGEHWLITGPNGSGKTILLEVLQGIVHVPMGEVLIDFVEGQTWDERYANRRKLIHYLPAHAIASLLKQHEGLYYQQRYYGIGDERIPSVRDVLGADLLKIKELNIPGSFSIEALLQLEITRLSNGQLKKVLLTKVMLSGIPRLLLLDYPFEGLDEKSRRDLCDFIDYIAEAYNTQIVLVDHQHVLPKVMNRKLTLKDFTIADQQVFDNTHNIRDMQIRAKAIPQQQPVQNIVDIRNLRIQYGDTVILDNFSWTVNKGERWALIGRNGAGKTTLFSMIFADHPMAYSQEIYLFGKRRGTGESIWDIKRRINYLGPELISYLSPQQILMTGRSFLKNSTGWDALKAEQLLASFEAEHFIDKPVRFLSSGELQVLLLISCFLKKGELLLLDEPFQFLDSRQKSNLTHYLRRQLSKDTTLILITHYADDLREWTDLTKRI